MERARTCKPGPNSSVIEEGCIGLSARTAHGDIAAIPFDWLGGTDAAGYNVFEHVDRGSSPFSSRHLTSWPIAVFGSNRLR
jgi:hypothetical protein